MTTTCNHALYAIIDVFTQYFDVLGDLLLEDLYAQLHWCVQQSNEQLARSGTNCLENLVISNGFKFSVLTWDNTCQCILDIFNATLPTELLSWKPAATAPTIHNSQQVSNVGNHMIRSQSQHSMHSQLSLNDEEHHLDSYSAPASATSIPHHQVVTITAAQQSNLFDSLLIKCVVQLELIQTVDNIIFYPATSRKEDAETLAAAAADLTGSTASASNCLDFQREEQGMYSYLGTQQLLTLTEFLMQSHRFAKRFNGDHEQRNTLWRAGFKGSIKPNLLRQETASLACVLRIFFKMYGDENRRDDWPSIEQELVAVGKEALSYYLSLQSEAHREAWTSLLLLILTRLLKMEDNRVSEKYLK